MIEKLNKLAVFIRPLKWPSLLIAMVLLVAAVIMTVRSSSREDDFLLIPSIAGFLWFFCLYVLIVNFQAMPRKVAAEDGFFKRIKVRLYRFWFFMLGWLFIFATGLVVFISSRLIIEWTG